MTYSIGLGNQKVGFIGAGKISQAIATGMMNKGWYWMQETDERPMDRQCRVGVRDGGWKLVVNLDCETEIMGVVTC